MILTKNRNNRYMMHIPIPDISGQGQKRVLDSSVILYSEDPNNASLALRYLAASGVGQIYCHFKDTSDWETLYENLLDLNRNIRIQLKAVETSKNSEGQAISRIIVGSPSFVKETLQYIIKSDCPEKYIPSIISIHNEWNGVVRTLIDRIDFEDFLFEMIGNDEYSNCIGTFSCPDNLSCYFSSLMAVVEHLKLALSIGKPLSEALYYDLSAMEFDFISSSSDLLCKRHNSKIHEKGFDALTDSKVLIIGCGGLGSPAAFALASSGIGGLGLVNSTSRIGMSRVQSAELFLKQINPNVRLETYNIRINKENVRDVISSYDIIIGSLDNLPDRYILNDACYTAKKPLIEASALDISGLATTITPDYGHCYRCIFPEPIDSNSLPSFYETGVLGPVSGILGIIQAAEAIKLITGIGEPLKNRMLLFDVFDTDIYVSDYGKTHLCELCSKK